MPSRLSRYFLVCLAGRSHSRLSYTVLEKLDRLENSPAMRRGSESEQAGQEGGRCYLSLVMGAIDQDKELIKYHDVEGEVELDQPG